MNLAEQLRPTCLEDLVGHERQRKQLEVVRNTTGLIGQAFWIVGPSGTGKTTMARIIASEVADDIAVEEIDAIDLSLEKLREFEKRGAHPPLFGRGYAFIVNEAHNMRAQCVSRLQTVLESDAMRNSVWVFTTTDAGQLRLFDGKFDGFPFLSRCIHLYLESTDDVQLAFAEHLRSVALENGLGPDDLDVYRDLVSGFHGNMRLCLMHLASGALCV